VDYWTGQGQECNNPPLLLCTYTPEKLEKNFTEIRSMYHAISEGGITFEQAFQGWLNPNILDDSG
jgi:hypothetical protein